MPIQKCGDALGTRKCKEYIMLMDKIKTIINRYCNAGIAIADKQVKAVVGYTVRIELPDRFNTEWGMAKIRQINKKLKEMIKCAEVKIIRHNYQDYLWIIYK